MTAEFAESVFWVHDFVCVKRIFCVLCRAVQSYFWFSTFRPYVWFSSWPRGPSLSLGANGIKKLDVHFPLTQKLAGMQSHTLTLYLKQLWKCEKEVGCAKLIMWHARTLLNRGLFGFPLLWGHFVLAACPADEHCASGWWSSLVKHKSEYEAILLVECPLTICLSPGFVRHTHTLCVHNNKSIHSCKQ